MKRFSTSLVMFMASLPFFANKSSAATADHLPSNPIGDQDPVKLRPLNLPGDNLFAAHRSHSSHGSHRSSSGGGSYVPTPREPTPSIAPAPADNATPGQSNSLYGPATKRPTDPGRAEPVSPQPAQPKPELSLSEKRKLQVMRVQISLTSLGLYKGTIDGSLNEGTKEALKLFQTVKGLDTNGLMTTDTLNALGVPAVQ